MNSEPGAVATGLVEIHHSTFYTFSCSQVLFPSSSHRAHDRVATAPRSDFVDPRCRKFSDVNFIKALPVTIDQVECCSLAGVQVDAGSMP
jgi:hypothetical protein